MATINFSKPIAVVYLGLNSKQILTLKDSGIGFAIFFNIRSEGWIRVKAAIKREQNE